MNTEWVNFAKKTLKQEEKVLMVTHFPMYDFEEDNCWKIFGHTHERDRPFQYYNNICAQIGKDNSVVDISSNEKQYDIRDFGILEKTIPYPPALAENFNMNISFDVISKFYTTDIVVDSSKELTTVKKIKGRGYKRASANRWIFAQIANNRQDYIKEIMEVMESIKINKYVGYRLDRTISEYIEHSIAILENEDVLDVRSFLTASIITGYVYNRMLSFIPRMRPLDDYDVLRCWLMFATIQKFNILPDKIESVRKNEDESLIFQNVEIYLPKVNDKSLKIEEVNEILRKVEFLPYRKKLD